METKMFRVEYILTLKYGGFFQTSTLVVAQDSDIALTKLKMWRETQEPKFDKIEFLSNVQVYNVVV